MIKIVPLFTENQLKKDMEDKLQVWFNSLAKNLMDSGKEMVNRAISKARTGPGTGGGFGNITYDLRSSMGVGLVIGKIVKETYFPFKATNSGKADGLALLNKVALEVNEEIALVMVAGEHYSVFVESKGYDVISLSFGTFDDYFKGLIKNA